MIYNKEFRATGGILLFLMLFSCQSEYTKLVNLEAHKGLQQDSLLFGMSFGDTKKSFFDRCGELNKEKLVSQGPNNRSVQYLLSSKQDDENLTAINMLFYGNFDKNDTMVGMDLEFTYRAWSLWNKDYEAKKLLPVVKDSLMKWFHGNPFIPLKQETSDTELFVKVDGNRQITAYAKNNKDVAVRIEDLKLKYPEKFE
ncbi:MAG: hypothetical protein MUO53_03000 [Maribacter sp.]|nr:hypothetical protein [Maribacter sp.]